MTTHGTNLAYSKGCHCDDCRAAHAAYNKSRRDIAVTAADRTDHGTNRCYDKGRCRCRACKAAHAQTSAITRARARERQAEEQAPNRDEIRQAREDKALAELLARFPDEFVVLIPLPGPMSWHRARRYARTMVLDLPEAKDLTFGGEWDWRLTRRPDGTRYISGRVAARSTRPPAEDTAAALAAADVYADHVPALAAAVRGQLAPAETEVPA